MDTVIVDVHPGVCKFTAQVTAVSEDQQYVDLRVESQCVKIQALGKRVPRLDSYDEIKNGFGGQFHQAVEQSLSGCCSGCVVPSAMFKAMQVVARLALPVDATMRFSRLPQEG